MSSPKVVVVGSANLDVISTTNDASINFYKTGTTDISYGGTARNISINLSVLDSVVTRQK